MMNPSVNQLTHYVYLNTIHYDYTLNILYMFMYIALVSSNYVRRIYVIIQLDGINIYDYYIS